MLYLLFFIFLLNSYFYADLLLPPKLNLIFPPPNLSVSDSKITFRGFVDKRAFLYINDEFLPTKNGYFEKEYYLKEGINTFIIKARKFWGQEKILKVQINRVLR
ncbi:MAG: hypothetical protein QXX45_04055 [Candidatus Aenigmatarchaeota archaeon]